MKCKICGNNLKSRSGESFKFSHPKCFQIIYGIKKEAIE